MKTQWVYTEINGQVVSCEVLKETTIAYSLKCFCFDVITHCIRAKSECFTNKAKAKIYFK